MNGIDIVKNLIADDLSQKDTFDFVVLARNPKIDFLSYSISLIDAYVKIKIYKLYPEDTRFFPHVFSEIDAIFMDAIMFYDKTIDKKRYKLLTMIEEYNESYDVQWKNTLSQKIQKESMNLSKHISNVYKEHNEVINEKIGLQLDGWCKKFDQYTNERETKEWREFIYDMYSFFLNRKKPDTA